MHWAWRGFMQQDWHLHIYARRVSWGNIARNVPQATFSIATVSASKIHVKYSRDTQFHALRVEITARATTLRATFQMAHVPVELAGRRTTNANDKKDCESCAFSYSKSYARNGKVQCCWLNAPGFCY